MKSTLKEIASKLNGINYKELVPKELVEIAKENSMVIIYGASDDLIEFEGAINDEIYVYGGNQNLGLISYTYNGLFLIDSPLVHEKFTITDNDYTGNGIVIEIQKK